ncbi:hypothetical protein ZWY2020_022529 [Hordeum vulgare]|nr:hypothetical protein ZWY2020_022529 [Hordeum vulgare]
MSRLRLRLRHSTSIAPVPHLCSSSISTSPPSRSWYPYAAFAAATERARAGALTPEDAHHLFDELLRQATPVPARSLNGLLTALSRAPDTESCRDGPALALALFNRIRREEAGSRVVSSTIFTYGILMNCCCRTRRPELGLALFGRVLRMGLKTNVVVVSTVLKCLCGAKRTDEAVNILLHRMSELGCVADAFSYTIVLKSLCDDSRSQRALDLLQMWEKERGVCSPNVVTYNTVIGGFFKEGEVSKACNLFHEMVQQGVVPNVVTYSLIIDALCKARAMDNAELFLRQMIDKGNGYINKYPTGLFLKDANRLRLRHHAYSRKQKSLGLLCSNFVALYDRDGVESIGLDDASSRLGVERRRIYDIVNVLESVGILARKAKNRYSWIGFGGVPMALRELKERALREKSGLAPLPVEEISAANMSDDEDDGKLGDPEAETEGEAEPDS